MWSSAIKFFKDNQPIGVTGFFAHAVRWPLAPFNDVVYVNPNFKPRTPGDKGIAVYCAHGIADRASAFGHMLDHMIENNILPDSVSTVHLVSFDQRFRGIGIPDYALQLQKKINQNRKNEVQDVDDPGEPQEVILFGHSRGGLVVSYLEAYLAQAANIKVRGVFTFGAPFAGSWLAIPPFSWFSTSIQQMARNSEFLIDLSKKIRDSAVRYFYYAAEHDFLVPPESACVKDHCEVKIMKRQAHLSLLSSLKMLVQMKPELDSICHDNQPAAVAGENTDANVLAEKIDEFVELKHQASDVVHGVCEEITIEIDNLSKRRHLRSSEAKIAVLEKLKSLLLETVRTHQNKLYPQANTIGEFITSFLHDDQNNDYKPIDILSIPLNVCLFGKDKSTSEAFVCKLIESYNNVPLAAVAPHISVEECTVKPNNP